jgi:predicted DNA-binding transcriptional regulator YafY
MTKHATISRLSRLEELKGMLKSCEHATAAALADELGVSLRTLHRDLEVLRSQGVPVESDVGRGGGLRLHRAWTQGRVHLSAEEAIDLLLSLAIAERMNSPVLLNHLAPVRRKIAGAFMEGYQGMIRQLRKRILVGKPASPEVLASYNTPTRAIPGIAEAFFNLRCVAITYVDRNSVLTQREIEPHFLYLSLPVWYLLVWDKLRGAIRYFRIDRIKSVTPLDTTFRLADPKPFLIQAEQDVETL